LRRRGARAFVLAAGAACNRIPASRIAPHEGALEEESMAEAPALDTFPRLLLQHAKVRGDRPATREKDLGI
jgi:hypothetical protein